ncbi:MAG TPA: universal stress protein [Polyangiaceae bacterium]|nr:universal stress protein [Polyangiaceae bacterium]
MGPVSESERSRVIVVGVDFSDASGEALSLACRIADRAPGRVLIYVVHVLTPLYLPSPGVELLPTVRPDTAERLEASHARMRRLVHGCAASSAAGLRAAIETHVCIGDTSVELETFARRTQADLIVLGGRRRSSIWRALHRSASARLARRAPCPVLIALPKEAADAGDRAS